jgi:hypothetical protein
MQRGNCGSSTIRQKPRKDRLAYHNPSSVDKILQREYVPINALVFTENIHKAAVEMKEVVDEMGKKGLLLTRLIPDREKCEIANFSLVVFDVVPTAFDITVDGGEN